MPLPIRTHTECHVHPPRSDTETAKRKSSRRSEANKAEGERAASSASTSIECRCVCGDGGLAAPVVHLPPHIRTDLHPSHLPPLISVCLLAHLPPIPVCLSPSPSPSAPFDPVAPCCISAIAPAQDRALAVPRRDLELPGALAHVLARGPQRHGSHRSSRRRLAIPEGPRGAARRLLPAQPLRRLPRKLFGTGLIHLEFSDRPPVCPPATPPLCSVFFLCGAGASACHTKQLSPAVACLDQACVS